jgi:hypothetical protein
MVGLLGWPTLAWFGLLLVGLDEVEILPSSLWVIHSRRASRGRAVKHAAAFDNASASAL